MSIAAGNGRVNVRRNVTSGTTLTSVSGAPARRASTLLFMNAADDGGEPPVPIAADAVFAGDDGVDVTVTVPAESSLELCGDFETVGTLDTGVTCIAGWVDDGSVARNG